MNVSVGQIYIKPGANFPFSHLMQRFLKHELSSVASGSAGFEKKYGPTFRLMVNVSADTQISDNVIKGPTVFKKDTRVEYTVFLPFDTIMAEFDGCRAAVRYLIAGIREVFRRAGIDTAGLDAKEASIIEHICSDPTMLTEPWPQRGAGLRH